MFRRSTLITLVIAGAILLIVSCYSTNKGGEALPDQVSYNFHIRPILSDKCFKCHGPDAAQRSASLRLDIADSAFAPLKETKGAFAIIPGKAEESELYKRITSTDTSYQMPTPDSHLGVLSEYEALLVKKWINQGAKYEKHWAFTSPRKPSTPEVADSKWVKNEIDKFVLKRLQQKGLDPNDEADKERLFKRISLDITGLPPSPEAVDAFIADKSADAYEKAIDKLLAAPQYGEKMAVYWMDLARYADSYGYQDDNIRTQWPWRDWVIHAFNTNLSFDKFISWQIAGDMLPNATKEQTLATGFFRNHKYTEEGGVIDEEYRIEYLLDKVKTYTKGVLGVTMECAQCHDHKYDPFSQKDYYQMLAFFNNTKEIGFEGDVSQSKPAKNPLMSFNDEDVKNTLSFINKQDTGTMTVSVLGELEDSVRKTFILNRGQYGSPTEEVHPAAPQFDSSLRRKEIQQKQIWVGSMDD